MSNEKLFMKTSDVSLTNHYYVWLLKLIRVDDHPGYSKLLKYLRLKEFYWSIPNDKNRSDDGKELRNDFLRENNLLSSDIWEEEPCSVLEMIIALARRISEDIVPDFGEDTAYWFWRLLDNLGVLNFTDDKYKSDTIEDIVSLFLDRKYNSDGFGGLFYTKNLELCQKKCHKKNFRHIEIWYQMQFWIAENVEI